MEGGWGAKRVRAGLLKRVLEVTTPDGVFEVEYNGRGVGNECIRVDGVEATRVQGTFWFVPRFEFLLGGRSAAVEVSVCPWLTLGSFHLTVEGTLLYCERAERGAGASGE